MSLVMSLKYVISLVADNVVWSEVNHAEVGGADVVGAEVVVTEVVVAHICGTEDIIPIIQKKLWVCCRNFWLKRPTKQSSSFFEISRGDSLAFIELCFFDFMILSGTETFWWPLIILNPLCLYYYLIYYIRTSVLVHVQTLLYLFLLVHVRE